MRRMRTMLWVVAICSAPALIGCGDKKITFIYANATSDTVDVSLVERGFAKVPLSVPADSEIEDEREIDRDFLPVTYKVSAAGMESDSFTVNKDTPDKLWFIIQPNKIIGPLKEGDRLESTWDIKVKSKTGHTIVE